MLSLSFVALDPSPTFAAVLGNGKLPNARVFDACAGVMPLMVRVTCLSP
jgi:hypothetical protein